jgi:hypothetical protein
MRYKFKLDYYNIKILHGNHNLNIYRIYITGNVEKSKMSYTKINSTQKKAIMKKIRGEKVVWYTENK